jgi:hypothetical protein
MELNQNFLILVPITIGLIEVFKRAGLPSRYAPMASILISCLLGYFLVGGDMDSIAQSIIAGLTASGLFSGTKAVVK